MTMEHGGPSVGELLYPAINFSIYLWIMWRYLAGPAREYFRERTEQIRQGLEAGAKARAAAEQLRRDVERAKAELPATQARIREELRATAEAQRDRTLEQARAAAERIRRDAETLARTEAVSARQKLRAQIIDEAVRRATELVRAGVRPDDQARFVRQFVESVRGAA